MIGASKLQLVTARSSEPGNLITWGQEDGWRLRFVSGVEHQDEDPVQWLLDLTSGYAFTAHYVDAAPTRNFLRIDEFRLAVDISTLREINSASDMTGNCVLLEDGPAIIIRAPGQNTLRKWVVGLDGQLKRVPQQGAYAFAKWKLVTGPQDREVELFSREPDAS